MGKSIYTKDHGKIIKLLKNSRHEAQLTQAEVARKLKLSQSYISKIESGQVEISVIMLKRLAKIYEKDVKNFL